MVGITKILIISTESIININRNIILASIVVVIIYSGKEPERHYQDIFYSDSEFVTQSQNFSPAATAGDFSRNVTSFTQLP